MEHGAQAQREIQERVDSRTAKLQAQLDALRKEHDVVRDALAKELEDNASLEQEAQRSADDKCAHIQAEIDEAEKALQQQEDERNGLRDKLRTELDGAEQKATESKSIAQAQLAELQTAQEAGDREWVEQKKALEQRLSKIMNASQEERSRLSADIELAKEELAEAREHEINRLPYRSWCCRCERRSLSLAGV